MLFGIFGTCFTHKNNQFGSIANGNVQIIFSGLLIWGCAIRIDRNRSPRLVLAQV
jgi:hypothetical protein